MYRGETSWSEDGTWEYDANSQTLTTTCGYTLTIEKLNSGELWCRDQYGELYMLHSYSSILNADEVPSWWDFDVNRRVIVGTWKHGTKAVTLKFYKDGQFLLSNGFASYVGNFFFGDDNIGDGSIYLSSDSFEFGDNIIQVSISDVSGMSMTLKGNTSASTLNETMIRNMIIGYYTYVKN